MREGGQNWVGPGNFSDMFRRDSRLNFIPFSEESKPAQNYAGCGQKCLLLKGCPKNGPTLCTESVQQPLQNKSYVPKMGMQLYSKLGRSSNVVMRRPGRCVQNWTELLFGCSLATTTQKRCSFALSPVLQPAP